MKPMIWKPEEGDEKFNTYLDQLNHAPYEVVMAILLAVFCLFTLVVIMGVF